MAGNHKWKINQKMTPLWYVSINSNPHPLESLDRDDSELETCNGLKSENVIWNFWICVENMYKLCTY